MAATVLSTGPIKAATAPFINMVCKLSELAPWWPSERTGTSLAVNRADLDYGKTEDLPKVVEVGSSAHSPFEFTGMDDFGFETILGKIFGIEGNYEIRLAGFGAEAKRVVLGIGRNLSRGLHLHLFSTLSD
jgi:hypothetical protein